MSYIVEIEGKSSLEEINQQIAGEEAGGSEFIDNSVKDGGNIAKFDELPPGTRPKQLTVVLKSGPQPAGTKQVWTGQMVVSNVAQSVTAYRAT
jgi:hypothetical protein